MALHVSLIHQASERHLASYVYFGLADPQLKAGLHPGDNRDNPIAERRQIEVEITHRFDMRAIEANFLPSFAEGRSARIGIALFNLPAGEGNLSRMVGQMLRPLGQKYGWLDRKSVV